MRAVCTSDCAASKFYFWAGNINVRSTSTIHRIAIVKERRLRARTVVVNNRTLRLKGKNPATGVCYIVFPVSPPGSDVRIAGALALAHPTARPQRPPPPLRFQVHSDSRARTLARPSNLHVVPPPRSPSSLGGHHVGAARVVPACACE